MGWQKYATWRLRFVLTFHGEGYCVFLSNFLETKGNKTFLRSEITNLLFDESFLKTTAVLQYSRFRLELVTLFLLLALHIPFVVVRLECVNQTTPNTNIHSHSSNSIPELGGTSLSSRNRWHSLHFHLHLLMKFTPKKHTHSLMKLLLYPSWPVNDTVFGRTSVLVNCIIALLRISY